MDPPQSQLSRLLTRRAIDNAASSSSSFHARRMGSETLTPTMRASLQKFLFNRRCLWLREGGTGSASRQKHPPNIAGRNFSVFLGVPRPSTGVGERVVTRLRELTPRCQAESGGGIHAT